MKQSQTFLLVVLSILALYGLIILTRKLLATTDYKPEEDKSARGWRFYIEPYGKTAPSPKVLRSIPIPPTDKCISNCNKYNGTTKNNCISDCRLRNTY